MTEHLSGVYGEITRSGEQFGLLVRGMLLGRAREAVGMTAS